MQSWEKAYQGFDYLRAQACYSYIINKTVICIKVIALSDISIPLLNKPYLNEFKSKFSF